MLIDIGLERKDKYNRINGVVNHVIYDSSDESFLFLTETSYNNISEFVKLTDYSGKSINYSDGVTLPKVIMVGNRFELFKDDKLVVYVSYGADIDKWHMFIELFNENLYFVFNTSYSHDDLVKPLHSKSNFKILCINFPALYVEYLVRNIEGRKREVRNILNAVDFKLYRKPFSYELLGIDMLESKMNSIAKEG